HLFHEGNYFQSYQFFGAHSTAKGVIFRLWAHSAQSVSIVGNFNDWNPASNPMQLLKDSGGICEAILTGLPKGELYKYCIKQCDGELAYKADPYGVHCEVKPKTASLFWELSGYHWKDQKWLDKRKKQAQKPQPVNIYEMHLGSWRTHKDGSVFTYRELAAQLVPYLKEMHYTHVEFMPIMEHPFDGSWGYQLTGFFAPTSRYGTPQDLMYLIDQLHQNEISVILDWVPGHFCKDAHGLYKLDGTNLYEANEHPQWGTMEFDFSKNEVVDFLISNAYYWFKEYHVDGLRIDGVASMIYLNYGYENEYRRNKNGGNDSLEAVAFLRKLNTVIFKDFPFAIMAAEESTAYPMVSWPVEKGGLGFNLKWDMGWMHDTLSYMETDPYCRSQFHSKLTFSMAYAFSENFILPLSHDEVVHGKKTIVDKMFGPYDMKFDQMRLLYAYMYFHSGKKLTFMGNEFAPFTEWRYYESLEWFMLDYEKHHQFNAYIKSLNKFYMREAALWQKDHGWDGFEWIDADNAGQSILIFRRMADNPEDDLIILINFCPQSYETYDIGVPTNKTYRLIFNSDDVTFGGSGFAVKKTAKGKKGHCHNQPYTATIAVPPSAAIVLRAVASKTKTKKHNKKKSQPSKVKTSQVSGETGIQTTVTEKPAIRDSSKKPVVLKDNAKKPLVTRDTSPKPVVKKDISPRPIAKKVDINKVKK
ncbi:MAG: 1,4-alpha-glucan branching protein GlgB, partial [Eubacteriaceae bacterium]|nr:1,4-alpha-glucan branching protein GlgB [Eubacteriaceae bacterium]